MPLIRMFEPGTFKLYCRLLRRFVSCTKKALEEEDLKPIRMLLDSTLNIEFVYVILEGIVKFSKYNFAMDNS